MSVVIAAGSRTRPCIPGSSTACEKKTKDATSLLSYLHRQHGKDTRTTLHLYRVETVSAGAGSE